MDKRARKRCLRKNHYSSVTVYSYQIGAAHLHTAEALNVPSSPGTVGVDRRLPFYEDWREHPKWVRRRALCELTQETTQKKSVAAPGGARDAPAPRRFPTSVTNDFGDEYERHDNPQEIGALGLPAGGCGEVRALVDQPRNGSANCADHGHGQDHHRSLLCHALPRENQPKGANPVADPSGGADRAVQAGA